MVTALSDLAAVVQPKTAVWPRFPHRMRALYIASREHSSRWLAEALAADSAMQIALEEAQGTAAGMARFRDEVFDAVLAAHAPGEQDALDLVEGLRAAGADEPIIVLGTQPEHEMAVLCYEVGADGYVCVNATTRNLIWVVARAVERRQLAAENERLRADEQARLLRECDEASSLLEQQLALLGEPAGAEILLPAELVAHYRELLRTYAMMSAGNLSRELHCLAKLLVTAGLTARQTMQLHLTALQELIRGLGTRSARHMMIRADLLAMELLQHLADGYRGRYQERLHPPVQRLLPGFA